jgi:hypothetical protein
MHAYIKYEGKHQTFLSDIVESSWRIRLHCTRDCRSRLGSGQPAVLAFVDGAQEKRNAESAGRNGVAAQKRFPFLNAEEFGTILP